MKISSNIGPNFQAPPRYNDCMIEAVQREICDRIKSRFEPPTAGSLVGV